MGNGSGERDTKNEEQQRGLGRLHRHERVRKNRRPLAHSFPSRAAEAFVGVSMRVLEDMAFCSLLARARMRAQRLLCCLLGACILPVCFAPWASAQGTPTVVSEPCKHVQSTSRSELDRRIAAVQGN